MFVSLVIPSINLVGQEVAEQIAPPPLTESLDQIMREIIGSPDSYQHESIERFEPVLNNDAAPIDIESTPNFATSQRSGVVMKLSDVALGGLEIPGFVENDSSQRIRVARNDTIAPVIDDTANRLEEEILATTATESTTATEATTDIEATPDTVLDPVPNVQLTTEEQFRQAKIKQCLSMFFHMPVDAEKWRPWTMMHGLLPFGQQSRIQYKNKLYNAVEYICYNAVGNDTHMMYVSNGELVMKVGPGVQGHEGQLLAMLAQADVAADEPIRVEGHEFTVADLIEYEKQSCRPGTELTFKLIGLSHYLESEEIWENSEGQAWNIERLIYEELKQPINGAACGGTHRLMGLSYAIRQRAEPGEQVN